MNSGKYYWEVKMTSTAGWSYSWKVDLSSYDNGFIDNRNVLGIKMTRTKINEGTATILWKCLYIWR